jgi:hypothetical protein
MKTFEFFPIQLLACDHKLGTETKLLCDMIAPKETSKCQIWQDVKID